MGRRKLLLATIKEYFAGRANLRQKAHIHRVELLEDCISQYKTARLEISRLTGALAVQASSQLR